VVSLGKRKFVALPGGAAVWPIIVRAQTVGGARRIGMLIGFDERAPEVHVWLAAFTEALAKFGWSDGQKVHFEFRWVGSDPSRVLKGAEELVTLQPDVIVSSSSHTTSVLLKQTRTIPIVFTNIVDPVGQGFVATLSRPGGNATGFVNLEPSMAGKWFELLMEVVQSWRE
jgi:putative ABC transport system substrate-binding protein